MTNAVKDLGSKFLEGLNAWNRRRQTRRHDSVTTTVDLQKVLALPLDIRDLETTILSVDDSLWYRKRPSETTTSSRSATKSGLIINAGSNTTTATVEATEASASVLQAGVPVSIESNQTNDFLLLPEAAQRVPPMAPLSLDWESATAAAATAAEAAAAAGINPRVALCTQLLKCH